MEAEKKVPIAVNDLFPVLNERLIELLKSLKKDDWERHTIARLWSVKDVAAHLLDGNLRTLSSQRDRQEISSSPKTRDYKDVVKWLNTMNADWVRTAAKLSPEVLIMLLEHTGQPVADYFSSLPPFENSIYPVDWAGETESQNWFHVAREYSERWIHQQQIRNAVKQEDGLMTRELFYPFMDTLMRGLPYAMEKGRAKANDDAWVKVSVEGDAGGDWFVHNGKEGWALKKETNNSTFETEVIFDADTAWKLFSKAIKSETAKRKVTINGNEKLANSVLGMVSVMA